MKRGLDIKSRDEGQQDSVNALSDPKDSEREEPKANGINGTNESDGRRGTSSHVSRVFSAVA